ncbi:hypothetical protein CXB51_016302 [Gossypium anomalum]|uniref:Integrase catalytic domain-containing protein n=1 Tax=Gossypium anomalum TaxID=47600 RepID=A0A8J6D276_9ROSI|nr:hypothetical protein CXB51_016302 [Gossypium anomalum]
MESLNGSRYFILFIDDSTRYCWIYFLKNKAEVVQAFLKFKTAAETETGCKLKSIRSENGTEYISAQFQDICGRTSIKHQLTNVYTPQQNGTEPEENGPDMDFDDVPIRGTRSLTKIYERAYVALVEPTCFEEAEMHECWKQAMANEIDMIEKNQTWELVEKPTNRKFIGVKWVYKAKQNADGSLNKLKARLVVKGFSQKYGLDYFETYAPVAKLDMIRVIVGFAAQINWNIHQLDVKSAFLNGNLEEEIYVEQPEGFKLPGKEDLVYRLRKALYGLKQAPRACLKFERSASEPTLYVKKNKTETQLVVSLYVDNLLVTGGDEVDLAEFKTKMKQMFEMTDLGLMTYFLGMEPTPTPIVAGLKLSSHEGHEEVYETTYRSLIGCLLCLTATRPDIMFAVSLLSRFMHCYNVQHFQTAKRVLRYIKAMVCWSSKKQSLVAQSTVEAEYVAAASAVNQAIWLRKILADLNLFQEGVTEILCDNKSAIAIAKNPVFHGRTKHFDIKLHVIREMEQACEIKLVHCNSEDQIADILTKGLGVSRFNKLRKLMGVCNMELKEEC